MKPCSAVGDVGGDRHRLDQRERIALEDHPVLERPGLRFVGVADQVVRPDGLLGDGLPFDAGRERGAAAADQPGVLELAQHRLRSHLDRAAQRLVAALGAVIVQAVGVHDADAPQQPQPRLALLWHRRPRRLGRCLAAQGGDRLGFGQRRQHPLDRLVAGLDEQACGSAVALAEAWAAQPGGAVVLLVLGAEVLLEAGDQLLGPVAAAGDVIAHVQDPRRHLVHRQQSVEGRDPVGVGGRHRQPLADVVQPTRADPAGAWPARPAAPAAAGGADRAPRGPARAMRPSCSTCVPPSQPDDGCPSRSSTAAFSASVATASSSRMSIRRFPQPAGRRRCPCPRRCPTRRWPWPRRSRPPRRPRCPRPSPPGSRSP